MSNEKRMQLVILSATTDETLRNDIESQLIHAKINVWHTGKIQAGDMRKNVIETELRKADIIMPLISADFWTQKTRRNELQNFIMPIVRDLRTKGITIIPVLAKPYHWEMSEFKDLDPLPSTGKPIAVGNKKLDDLLEIAITLSEMAENLSPTPKSNAETKDTSYIEPQKTTEKMPTNTEKPIVFIVHGHNDNMKDKVELFVKNLDFKPIVLHKQINGGRTIIEKFE